MPNVQFNRCIVTRFIVFWIIEIFSARKLTNFQNFVIAIVRYVNDGILKRFFQNVGEIGNSMLTSLIHCGNKHSNSHANNVVIQIIHTD